MTNDRKPTFGDTIRARYVAPESQSFMLKLPDHIDGSFEMFNDRFGQICEPGPQGWVVWRRIEVLEILPRPI